MKKLTHSSVEKFCEMVESGWGKGVGSTGGVDGTVGTPVFEGDALPLADALGSDEGVEEDRRTSVGGKDDAGIEGAETGGGVNACGSGCGCRLCKVQSDTVTFHLSQSPFSCERTSSAAGCASHCVESAMKMRSAGMRTTARSVLRPVSFFECSFSMCACTSAFASVSASLS